jgi:hypothetical protein
MKNFINSYIDFHHVKNDHQAIHKRLLNWGAWCKDGKGSGIAPMFRNYKSKWRQWHEPEIRDVVDGIDAQRIQKLMASLPIEHRRCLAWFYTSNKTPSAARRELGKTLEALYQLLVDSRQAVFNLGGI